MEQLERVKKKLKTAHEKLELDYSNHTREQDDFETKLLERFRLLDEQKHTATVTHGDINASDDDRIEINAGGKIVAAKRGTLCQLTGTRLEALFSGRWDKKLQKDSSGRIFLDVNGDCFQAIVDYLNELVISSQDEIPKPPIVDDEHKQYLECQLVVFGITVPPQSPDSNIMKNYSQLKSIHEWLKEDGSNGGLNLLYRSSRDGSSNDQFHHKVDTKGRTLLLIETTEGGVLGGYTNTPWCSLNPGEYECATKAFLFALSGFGLPMGSPCKMKLKDEDDEHAMFNGSVFGPMFGSGNDVWVDGCHLNLNIGSSYEEGPSEKLSGDSRSYIRYTIKEMEVFLVSGKAPRYLDPREQKQRPPNSTKKAPFVDRFAKEINDAITEKWLTLQKLEGDLTSQEEIFNGEEQFVDSFASGDKKDVITLDVSGTIMATRRDTLLAVKASVLAQQFDDTKWTEQGNNKMRVKEWITAEVCNWVANIEGIQDGVSSLFEENNINGPELLALSEFGLEKMGVNRVGTTCLLLNEIKLLEKKCQDVSTLIEHSPYCFGKIVDHLRLKHLHSIDLAEKPALPIVCATQKERFEKVVKYYFPGESSTILLDSTKSIAEETALKMLNDAVLACIISLGSKFHICITISSSLLFRQSYIDSLIIYS